MSALNAGPPFQDKCPVEPVCHKQDSPQVHQEHGKECQRLPKICLLYTSEYSYTWRVTDGWAPGWADVRMEAEVRYDQSTGEWHLARTDIRAVRGFCTSSKTIEEIPTVSYTHLTSSR